MMHLGLCVINSALAGVHFPPEKQSEHIWITVVYDSDSVSSMSARKWGDTAGFRTANTHWIIKKPVAIICLKCEAPLWDFININFESNEYLQYEMFHSSWQTSRISTPSSSSWKYSIGYFIVSILWLTKVQEAISNKQAQTSGVYCAIVKGGKGLWIKVKLRIRWILDLNISCLETEWDARFACVSFHMVKNASCSFRYFLTVLVAWL